ncbi:tRNA pseudouridine(13) synthase TruD [Persephonella atlantica]|uniref:tRNA pseudouridine(13) synthase TruD n=1 Tax=Persephonella atlantica TaxID=2699429 RepID=A0ABS1GF90_9AQUI|nr:tRNA pseudouridine(13) synthase TruD [Persephonella atlantica]MBK3331476.1 tRNA pseudouridine(13) synthase TruD [Persephonella atlantica]
MDRVYFRWKVKEKPEDFIVKEVMDFQLDERGDFFLYMLIKRNLNTRAVCYPLKLSYAGLKDKNAITFQYVSSKINHGDYLIKKIDKDSFFALIKIGKIKRKIKIGHLKGNQFSIKLKGVKLKNQNWFINYYDVQRLSRNREKGKAVIRSIRGKSWKKLSWFENFYLDAYLSYLWNESVRLFLMDNYKGHIIQEERYTHFIPEIENVEKLPKFWPILGYKVKIEKLQKDIYSELLKKEGFSYQEFIERLKDLKIKGDYRKSYIIVSNFNTKGDRINFFLPKGSYATMFLKHLYVE